MSILQGIRFHVKFSGSEEPSSTLQLVQIYFDTASYDQVHILTCCCCCCCCLASSLLLFFVVHNHNNYHNNNCNQIVRDKKLKFEAQLSLIGGTMGLLTGFSIISAVEIVYFLIKLFINGLFGQNKYI